MSQVEKMALVRSVMNLNDAEIITESYAELLVRKIEERYKENKK